MNDLTIAMFLVNQLYEIAKHFPETGERIMEVLRLAETMNSKEPRS